jgi:quercetin dioxygenase-like cupin family protein
MRLTERKESPMTAITAASSFAIGEAEGTSIWHMGALMTFKARGEDTGGLFWLAEQTSEQGYASPLHQHSREDELFVVLDGQLTVRVADDAYEVSAGGVAFLPRQRPHTFRVDSPVAKFLVFSTPAGFENWFIETGIPAQSLTVPPLADAPPDEAAIGALISSLASYGVSLLGPPPV